VQVGFDNLIGNTLHLGSYGIGPIAAAKGMRAKTIELNQYIKNQEDIGALKIGRASYAANSAEVRRLNARIAALEGANDSLSIAPLIKAGEFSTISENLDEADVAIRQGDIYSYLEEQMDKLPTAVRTTIKNVTISKETTLFQGMSRFVQYGDFIAKAVLYDHLTQKKKQSEREALDVIFEEFVAFNRLAGRSRDGLEGIGLLWFWKYKIRIQKVAIGMMRDRPLSALMMMGEVAPALGIHTAWDGSLLAKFMDGSIDYSVGPEMGLGAPSLNPWWAVLDVVK
jgi:hypothetical protein